MQEWAHPPPPPQKEPTNYLLLFAYINGFHSSKSVGTISYNAQLSKWKKKKMKQLLLQNKNSTGKKKDNYGTFLGLSPRIYLHIQQFKL